VRQYGQWNGSRTGGFSWLEFDTPKIFILNLRSSEKMVQSGNSRWSIPSSHSVKFASLDGSLNVFQERKYERSGCCSEEYFRFSARKYQHGRETELNEQFIHEISFGQDWTTSNPEVFLSSDGSRAVFSWHNSVEIRNLDSGAVEMQFPIQPSRDCGVAFDPINDLLAVSATWDITVFSIRTMKTVAKFGMHCPRSLLFVDGYLLAEAGFTGWSAFALGAQSTSNWEHALRLRRISLKAPEQITQAEKEFVRELRKNESWLSPSQSRWLHSVGFLLEDRWRG
jgi:hypothetical protein